MLRAHFRGLRSFGERVQPRESGRQSVFARHYVNRQHAQTSHCSPLVKELVTLRDVVYELNKSNRGVIKRSILQTEAGQSLKELLLFLYDPHVRTNVTSAGVQKYLEKRTAEGFIFSRTKYVSIMSLLRELETRQVTGNAAMDQIGSFLKQLKGEEEVLNETKEQTKLSLEEIVMRCLDCNLKAGINANTIQHVFGSKDAENEDGSLSAAGQGGSKWGVALGKSCNLNHLQHLLRTSTEDEGQLTWFMSRKLDGVRCIVKMTFDVCDGVKIPLKVVEIETLSRTGRTFTSLDVLKEELSRLVCECPSIASLLEESLQKRNRKNSSIPDTMSLFLDGEICALIPDGESKDGFKEDFSAIVGPIRRQSSTIPNPAYFPFDVLNEAEFLGWREEENHLDREPFYVRVRRVRELVKYCQERGSINVRRLEQTPVRSYEQVKEASEEAAAKGWEGLIFRKGDKYVGKRTSSICKYKQWQEAEYTVLDIQKATMRLPVKQQYEERQGLASVTISHNGTEVFVGSGFTVEERIRYAADPNLIIGKQITVQYFGESTSAEREDKGLLSLRFPRVKQVWEEGMREV